MRAGGLGPTALILWNIRVSQTLPLRLGSSRSDLDCAAALLREGRLVAFPTETVYGLGALAADGRAVAAIFAAKGRPRFNPLIAHYADPSDVARDVTVTPLAAKLAARFWPGPLTLVLRRREGTRVSPLLSAGLDTLAVRVPSHPVAHALLAVCGAPVAAPSANRSNAISPTTAEHVLRSLGSAVAAIVDGGACPVGVESTVVDATGTAPILLRPGGVPLEEIEEVAGPAGRPAADAAPTSPGMLKRHYAPSIPLRLDAREAGPGEVLLGFGPEAPEDAANLSRSGDLAEAAANLFGMLWELDRAPHRGIAVMPVPERGLGQAINDRLRRGAAAREEP